MVSGSAHGKHGVIALFTVVAKSGLLQARRKRARAARSLSATWSSVPLVRLSSPVQSVEFTALLGWQLMVSVQN
jgi:hypothetical protein